MTFGYGAIITLAFSFLVIIACTKTMEKSLDDQLSDWDSQFRAGSWESAEKSSLQLLESAEHLKGKESIEYTGAINRVAITKQMMGKYDEAIQWFRKELELNKKILNPRHPDIALALSNIGHCLKLKGDYSAAIDTLMKSLSAFAQSTPQLKDESGYINAHYLLATTYGEIGRYDEAQRVLMKIMNTSYMRNVEDTNQVVTILSSMALFALQRKDIPYADTLSRQAFALSRQAFGSWSIQMAEVANIMGLLFDEVKDYQSSEELFLMSLRIRDTLGRVDDYYALTLSNLSMLYMSIEAYSKADSVLDRATSLYEKLGESNSLQMASVFRNKSSVAASLGRFDSAERYKLQALNIYEQKTGHSSVLVLEVLESLLDLYIKTDRKQDAIAVETRIRQIKESNPAT